MPTALIAHPSADVYGSDRQLLESIDGLRDAGRVVTLCLPASGSLVELVRGSDVQRVPFAVLCKALLGLLPLLRPVLRTAIDVARLLHRIRVIRPDVMYVKTVTIPLWIIAARLAQARRCACARGGNQCREAAPCRLEGAAAARSTVAAKSNASEKLVTDGFRRLARKVRGVPNDMPDGGAARSDATLPG